MTGNLTDTKTRFEALYDSHARDLLRFAYLRLMSKEQAQDVVGETFLRFWERMVAGATIGNERALLYTILRGIIIDTYRKRSIRVEVPLAEDMEELIEHSNVEHTLDLKQDIARALEALGSLKSEYADIISLHYLQELSVPEVAEVLGLTENNTRVRIHRALTALKEHFDHGRS